MTWDDDDALWGDAMASPHERRQADRFFAELTGESVVPYRNERADPFYESLTDEAVSNHTFQIRNRVVRSGTVADCDIELTGAGGTVRGNGGAHGRVVIDVGNLADGGYTLQATPRSNSTATVGPALAAATPRPSRIWRTLSANATVQSGRITSIAHPDVSISGRTITLRIQPVWMASPNRRARPVDTPIDLAIVHHTAGRTAGPAINTFLHAGSTSAHYVIDVDGQIIKMVHESETAAHAGISHWAGRDSLNSTSIGIEIVHRSGPYPAAQITAVTTLLQSIRAAHPNIPVRRIIGHADIATHGTPRRLGRKAGDPGPEFPWFTLAVAGLGMPVPTSVSMAIQQSIRSNLGLPAIYGNFFTLVTGGRLRSGDRDSTQTFGRRRRPAITHAVINELQTDLSVIGYFSPVDGTFGGQTTAAVRAFQEHFFSGSIARAAHPGQVDERTAEAIKAVR